MKLLCVNFHYFRQQTYKGGIYPTSEEALHHQVQDLSKRYRFVSQSDLIQFLDGNRPDLTNQSCCLLTWDDGLKEQMAAFECLSEWSVPSVYYIPTQPLDHATVLDVHKLHYIRTEWDDTELEGRLNRCFAMNNYTFNIDRLANQYRYDDEVARKIKFFINFVLSPQEKQDAIDSWFAELAGDESSFSKNLYMSKDDLIQLSNSDAIGGHGHSHIPLATQEPAIIQSEIQKNLQRLKERTGESVRSFSYPFGGTTAVNTSLASYFARTNVAFALTMWRGENNLQNSFEPLFLQRVDTNDAPGGKNFVK